MIEYVEYMIKLEYFIKWELFMFQLIIVPDLESLIAIQSKRN